MYPPSMTNEGGLLCRLPSSGCSAILPWRLAVGGGGLGDLGIRYGYQRFMPEMMLGVVV
jgi:hypothetical protein